MSRATILVADDNRDILFFLRCMLEDEDFTVVMVDSGRAAFDKLNEVTPDLILTDLKMSDNGSEFIRQVRQLPQYAEIPILAMTVYGEEEIAEARRAGATDVIRKPEEMHRMAEKIIQVLRCER